jgi:orotate phosphoribosyltransferase
MSERDDLRKLIHDLALVRGRVVLSSGAEADFYLDLRRLTLHHAAAPLVGKVMLDLVEDWDFDAVGGLTLGADPVAAAMLHEANQQRRIEGPDVTGRRVIALDDTSTTGSSVLTAVDALRQAGAEVIGTAFVVDRGAGDAIRAAGLETRSAFTLTDLDLHA